MSGQPITFQRIYADAQGPEYPATPAVVEIVLASMRANADHAWNSFRVKFRFANGPPVIVSPRKGGR